MVSTMNKKGITKIIEATIAIIIISGVALLLAANSQNVSTSKDLSATLSPYLDEVAKDSGLRTEIVMSIDTNQTEKDIEKYLSNIIINKNYGFNIRVCPPADACALNDYPADANGDVYAAERIVSTALRGGETRKVKLYLWRVA